MDEGLTTKQAASLLRIHGENSIPKEENNILKTIAHQFTNPMVFLLIFACIVSFALQNILDGAVTLIIITLNAVIGFVQEYRADEAYKKLSRLISSNVEVIRNGKKQQINKGYLVPGDLIILKLGDIVPADSFVLEIDNLVVDESSLTGESRQIYKTINLNKDKTFINGILFSGSNIIKGSVIAKVFATGINSKFGEISNLTVNTKKISEYEQNLKKLSRYFIFISIFALAFIFLSHLLINRKEEVSEILLFTIAIAIAIIPEAMPVVANLTLAKGALRLSQKHVIVKRNSAIEDLGNIDLICTDKTGTLTFNKLRIAYYENEIPKNEFLKYSFMSSAESSDPIDICISNYLKFENIEELKLKDYSDTPFDPIKKFSSREFTKLKIIKGAPEFILKLTKNESHKILELIEKNEHKGMRAISFAVDEYSKDPKYIGTYFFYDEIKSDVDEVIVRAHNLGIKLKIITGDSKEVSIYVGKKVKLIKNDDEAIEAKDLHFDDAKILQYEVEKYKIFARCDPVQKYKIIEALQKKHFVGYLGDGINDAPSIKLSNVSIVVDTASDIAKASADIIMLSKGLDVILEGVVEGRVIFENIDKYIKNTLVGNFGGFFTIGLLSLAIDFLPMLPIQILITNLLTDIPGLSIATDNVDRAELKKPQQHSIRNIVRFALMFGIISSLFDLIFFVLAKGTPSSIQTQWFLFSNLTELIVLFSLRSKNTIFSRFSVKPSESLVLFAIIAVLISSVLALTGLGLNFQPIQIMSYFFVVGLAIAYAVVTELIKKPAIKRFKLD